jgi:hypothetical protein
VDWSSVGEVVKVLGPVATAGAAWFAATIAYRGLEKWREETIGKRKVELAETVLADFYRFEEVVRAARGPFVFNVEMGPKEGVPDEIASDSHFAPKRLMDHEEFLSRLRVRKYEFAAVFGKDAAAPFDEIQKVQNDLPLGDRLLASS